MRSLGIAKPQAARQTESRMDPELHRLIQALHASARRYALVATGGGGQAAALLLNVPGASRTILGHYDPGLGTITLNCRLDSPHVPRYVVEYLVIHEMLHTQFPVRPNGYRRVIHSREFRNAEKQFPEYPRAIRWLKAHSIAGAR